MTVKHRGMIAEQAENHHVMIFDKNGNFAMSCTFDRPISENELKSTIDNYFNFKSKVEEAKQGAAKELEELKQKIEDSDAAKADALKRAEELQKKLAISSSPEATKFSFYFEALDTDYENIIGSISTLKKEAPEIADKYAAAMQKYQLMVAENFAAIGYPFQSGERKTAIVEKYPDSEDTGSCSECGSCCSISDNFCSFCGAEITEVCHE